MVRRVVVLVLFARDDAARTPVVRARSLHGVLVVIALGLVRQDALPVVEDAVVFGVRVRAALVDQVDGVVGLVGKLGLAQVRDVGAWRARCG